MRLDARLERADRPGRAAGHLANELSAEPLLNGQATSGVPKGDVLQVADRWTCIGWQLAACRSVCWRAKPSMDRSLSPQLLNSSMLRCLIRNEYVSSDLSTTGRRSVELSVRGSPAWYTMRHQHRHARNV